MPRSRRGGKAAIANRYIIPWPSCRRQRRSSGSVARSTARSGALCKPLQPGDGQQRQPAGKDRGAGNADQTAPLNVFRIAVVHAEVGPGRAGRGEEAHDIGAASRRRFPIWQSGKGVDRGAAGQRNRLGLAGCHQRLGSNGHPAHRRNQENDQNRQWNEREEARNLGHILDSLKAHEGGTRSPNRGHNRVRQGERTVAERLTPAARPRRRRSRRASRTATRPSESPA